MVDLSQFSDTQILAATAWGENRGGGIQGMTSVLNVIMNRAAEPSWWGDSPRDVCLKPEQFDTWDSDDPNYPQLLAVLASPDAAMSIALGLATQALAGTLPDITNGSTMYYAASMTHQPYWAKGHTPTVEIAGQYFFSDIS